MKTKKIRRNRRRVITQEQIKKTDKSRKKGMDQMMTTNAKEKGYAIETTLNQNTGQIHARSYTETQKKK